MESLLIYCRPRTGTRANALAGWLDQRAAELSARPGIRRTTVVPLTMSSTNGPHDRGWLLDCELVDPHGPPRETFNELLTDMRLVGFDPIIFMAQPQLV